MAGVEEPSEFDSFGVMPNTVYPKDQSALTPSDKLRLQSITGQDEDSKAPVNPYHWYGNGIPDPDEERRLARERQAEARRIRKQTRDRYRETRTHGLN